MNTAKGKLAYTEENMQLILDLTQNEKYCHGINDYGFICYMKLNKDNSQLWAIVNTQSHQIRNAGLNVEKEHREWLLNIGFDINIIKIKNYNLNPYPITFFQVFNAMRIYVIYYWQIIKNDDIAMMITDFMLTKKGENWRNELYTWDPPVKDDWLKGVYKTLDESVDIYDHMYNSEESFFCMKNYLRLFYNDYPFVGVRELLDKIDSIKINSDSVEWSEYLKCIQIAIEQEKALAKN